MVSPCTSLSQARSGRGCQGIFGGLPSLQASFLSCSSDSHLHHFWLPSSSSLSNLSGSNDPPHCLFRGFHLISKSTPGRMGPARPLDASAFLSSFLPRSGGADPGAFSGQRPPHPSRAELPTNSCSEGPGQACPPTWCRTLSLLSPPRLAHHADPSWALYGAGLDPSCVSHCPQLARV